jgi:glycerol-3-phosphate dehydrogenase subunit B
MAGLSAALRLAEAGQKTLLMASGQSALHFSSGSVDLLESEGSPRRPARLYGRQPRASLQQGGAAHIAASLDDLQRHCAAQGLPLFRQERNHQRLTPSAPSKPPGSPPTPAPA